MKQHSTTEVPPASTLVPPLSQRDVCEVHVCGPNLAGALSESGGHR
jgi:hypothetical protein